MSDQMLEYYKQYHKAGGAYTMEVAGKSSRVLLLMEWIKAHTPKGGSVLDIGCGDMALSTYLPEYNWTGIDIAIDKAKGKAAAHDLMQTPYDFDAASFDTVVCSEVLEHVWDMRVIHNEVFRLLKPDGQYLISTPNFNWVDHHMYGFRLVVFDPTRPWTMEHIRQYDAPTHGVHLQDAGFKVLELCGADAQYGEFFKNARIVLKGLLLGTHKLPLYLEDGQVDLILGRMFPDLSHTIALRSVRMKGVQ